MGSVEIGRRDNYYRKLATAKKHKGAGAGTREDALLMSRDLSIIEDENDL